MPRWFRLIAAVLIYAVIMAVVSRTIHVWALPPDEQTFESVASRMATMAVFAIVSAIVVYYLFVRSGRRQQDAR
jgi:Na+/H+ antiporter NhaC